MEIESALLNFIVYKNGNPELPQLVAKPLANLSADEQREVCRYIYNHFSLSIIGEIFQCNLQ